MEANEATFQLLINLPFITTLSDSQAKECTHATRSILLVLSNLADDSDYEICSRQVTNYLIMILQCLLSVDSVRIFIASAVDCNLNTPIVYINCCLIRSPAFIRVVASRICQTRRVFEWQRYFAFCCFVRLAGPSCWISLGQGRSMHKRNIFSLRGPSFQYI